MIRQFTLLFLVLIYSISEGSIADLSMKQPHAFETGTIRLVSSTLTLRRLLHLLKTLFRIADNSATLLREQKVKCMTEKSKSADFKAVHLLR